MASSLVHEWSYQLKPGIAYDFSGNVSVGGLFRFKIGPSVLQPPVWTPPLANSFSFIYGTASSYSFASNISSGSATLTFFTSGAWPSGAGINVGNRTIFATSSAAVGSYSGLSITALDPLGQSASSSAFTIIEALSNHPPVWSSTFISVQTGSAFNLNTICTDPDYGDVITFSSLTSLPAGITLNGVTGILSVASNVVPGAYSARFRATDLNNNIADSQNVTISVIGQSVSWNPVLPIPGFTATVGAAQSFDLTQYILNWDPLNWVIQLDASSALLPQGWWLDFAGSINYNGIGPAASVSGIVLSIAPALQNFAVRRVTRGQVLVQDFEDASTSLGHNQPGGGVYGDPIGIIPSPSIGAVAGPTIDTGHFASGTQSLKFTIPANAPDEPTGDWFTRFDPVANAIAFGEGDTFYVQWRMFLDPGMLQMSGGLNMLHNKFAIISQNDDNPACVAGATTTCRSTCTFVELVITNSPGYGLLRLYNSCPGSGSYVFPTGGNGLEPTGPGGITLLQNARPAPYCAFEQTSNGTTQPVGSDCIFLVAGQWMTVQAELRIGTFTPDPAGVNGGVYAGSHVRFWVQTAAGQPSILTHDVDWPLAAGFVTAFNPRGYKYGKIWFTQFKNSQTANTATFCCYDELIVSRNRLADPL